MEDCTDTDRTIERSLSRRIHSFSSMVDGSFFERTEKPFGIGITEWRVLSSVIHSPGSSQTEISSREGLHAMNVSRSVAGLRSKGLVSVEPDPDDRRRTLLFATDRGRAVGRDIAVREQVFYEHVFAVLDPDEVALLDDVMSRINDGLTSRELPPVPPASQDWRRIVGEDAGG